VTLQEAIAIAQRTIEGKATIDEKKDLRAFIDSYPDKGQLIGSLFPLKDWEKGVRQQLPSGIESRVLEKILGQPLPSVSPSASKGRGLLRQFTRIAAAVVIAISLTGGLFLLFRQPSPRKTASKNITLTTQDGQVKNIVLADGTHILLNGGSSLRFPENFNGDTREVYLDGEAFFDVSKDNVRPFIIHSPLVSTTVLGTSFNMRSASREQVAAIAVATGKIKVAINDGILAGDAAKAAQAVTTVTPGQEAVYLSRDPAGIQKKQVNTAGIGAWKDHWFYYDQTPLKEILADLQRCYGLHFNVMDPAVLNCTYSATFKNISTNSILQTLTLMGHVNFKKKDALIEVTGTACH
jgi:transmembrane sensor